MLEFDPRRTAVRYIKHIRYGPMYRNVKQPDQFLADVKGGTLPAVTWLNPTVANSEHPGFASVCVGQNYTVEMSTDLGANWMSLFVTNSATTNSINVIDPGASDKQRFYRLKFGP